MAKFKEVHCDSYFVIAISRILIFYRNTKHIKVQYHFVNEAQNNCEVKLVEDNGKDQLANIFTKPLLNDKFKKLRGLLGMKTESIEEEC